MRPELHLAPLGPALFSEFYRSLVIRRLELVRREDAAFRKDVQTIFLHSSYPTELIEHADVTNGTHAVCALVHIDLCTCAHCLIMLS